MGISSASGGARDLYMRMVLHESTNGGQQQRVGTSLGLERMKELARFASAAMDAFDGFESQFPPVAPSQTETPVPNEPSALSKGMGEAVVTLTKRTTQILHLALSMLPKRDAEGELKLIMDLIRQVEDAMRHFEKLEAAEKKEKRPPSDSQRAEAQRQRTVDNARAFLDPGTAPPWNEVMKREREKQEGDAVLEKFQHIMWMAKELDSAVLQPAIDGKKKVKETDLKRAALYAILPTLQKMNIEVDFDDNRPPTLSSTDGEPAVIVHMSAVELKFCDMMIDKVAEQMKTSFPITDAERDAQLALRSFQKKVKIAISKL